VSAFGAPLPGTSAATPAQPMDERERHTSHAANDGEPDPMKFSRAAFPRRHCAIYVETVARLDACGNPKGCAKPFALATMRCRVREETRPG